MFFNKIKKHKEKDFFNKDLNKKLPNYINSNFKIYRSLYIHFENEESINKFSELIKQKINKNTRFVIYPKPKFKK